MAGKPSLKSPVLTAVVPCCDEEEAVGRFPAELFPALDALGVPYEVLVVDDGSLDGTAAAVERLASDRPEVRLLRHEGNRGLGAALATGLAAARGELLAFLDADLTFHPRHLKAMLEACQAGADCVAGSPLLGGMPGVSPTRRLPSLLLNAVYRVLFERRLTSYTPMFRLYRVEALRALSLESRGFEVSAEVLVKLLRRGARVVELPVPLTVRSAGASKLRRLRELRNHLRLIRKLLKM